MERDSDRQQPEMLPNPSKVRYWDSGGLIIFQSHQPPRFFYRPSVFVCTKIRPAAGDLRMAAVRRRWWSDELRNQLGQGSTFTFTLPVIVERQLETA